MLQDLDSPRTKAIFAAARELDALQRLWQTGKFTLSEVDTHISRLRSISAAQFQDSAFIRRWLDELGAAFAAKQSGEISEERYKTATNKLDSGEGFETVFI